MRLVLNTPEYATFPLPKSYCNAYKNPFQIPICHRTVWERTDSEIDFDYKCFTSYSKDSISSEAEWPTYSPFLENDCMENLYLLQQKCGASFESEANNVGDRLVASTQEFVNSYLSLMHCNRDQSTLAEYLMEMDVIFKANDEREDDTNQEDDPLFWPLNPDSYWHIEVWRDMDVIFKANDEHEDNINQEDPIFWPLNPDQGINLMGLSNTV